LLVSAVVKDTIKNRFLLYSTDGKVVYTFPKDYLKVENSEFTYFPLKALKKNGYWYLLDSNGNEKKEFPFKSSQKIHRTADVWHNLNGTVWENQCYILGSFFTTLLTDQGEYIIDNTTKDLKPIAGGYKTVYTLNSPYKNNYRVLGEKYENDYFLVEDFNGNAFFVDKDGIEYK
jgi:hypothetical protein